MQLMQLIYHAQRFPYNATIAPLATHWLRCKSLVPQLLPAGKENQQWQPDHQAATNMRSHTHQHKRNHRHHQQQQQEQQRYAPRHMDDSGSDTDSSSSSDGMEGLRLAAERSARQTAAEVATLAAMLNPPRSSEDHGGSGEGAPNEAPQNHQQQQSDAQAYPTRAPLPSAIDSSVNGGAAAAAAAAAGSSSSSSPMAEVRRLLKEKAELLSTGLYGRQDAVILQIDARVQALAELAAGS
jgi:hypothetical protein